MSETDPGDGDAGGAVAVEVGEKESACRTTWSPSQQHCVDGVGVGVGVGVEVGVHVSAVC